MNQAFEPANEYPRIAELVVRFREIGQTAMCDLPLCNLSLEVEAVGFRLVKRYWIGSCMRYWRRRADLTPTSRRDYRPRSIILEAAVGRRPGCVPGGAWKGTTRRNSQLLQRVVTQSGAVRCVRWVA